MYILYIHINTNGMQKSDLRIQISAKTENYKKLPKFYILIILVLICQNTYLGVSKHNQNDFYISYIHINSNGSEKSNFKIQNQAKTENHILGITFTILTVWS